jgi:hypothetical protein
MSPRVTGLERVYCMLLQWSNQVGLNEQGIYVALGGGGDAKCIQNFSREIWSEDRTMKT